MVKKAQGKGRGDGGASKCANSDDCKACKEQCPNGKKFLKKLTAKKFANCPPCVKK